MFNCEKCKSKLNTENDFFPSNNIKCDRHGTLLSFTGPYKCDNCNFENLDKSHKWVLPHCKICSGQEQSPLPPDYERDVNGNITCYFPNDFHDHSKCSDS